VLDFLRLSQEEGPLLDYKQADRSSGGVPDSTFETIVAFANTYRGLLILGVRMQLFALLPNTLSGKHSCAEPPASALFSGAIPEVYLLEVCGGSGEGGASEPASGGDGSAAPSRKHHIDVGDIGVTRIHSSAEYAPLREQDAWPTSDSGTEASE
jgi:hypothetical protein